MLEIRNLTKVYRSKTGEEVRALDNVSISFPESGMVFILGKSGSGKSTLLNIMGGLDSYDSGEFVIKGKSSKDFAGSDFDAYRNTFIGFIFQEYNVLDDFTVGANIGLALELQGKKATSERISEILSQVDLLNYAKRKPNELSGGQKQRVAIARALVKDPQIIMADEPTGALDSNTGKQIFDTLKQLSREKLVLVVSHDRDFAERYADRIIELSDGRIISDVTKHEHESEKVTAGIDRISPRILRIKSGYRLTANDLQMINEYLEAGAGDVILSNDDRVNEELRSAAGISERGTTAVFESTDAEKDYQIKTYEKKDSHFIRSRLPAKDAVRMGAGGLKHKKFRLVMTVFLSLIAFTLFGFADSLAGYQKITGAVDSISDSNVKNASVTLGVRRTIYNGDNTYVEYYDAMLNDADIAYLNEKTGLDFVPVFTGGVGYQNAGFSMTSQMQSYQSSALYTGKIHGFVDLDAQRLTDAGFSVTGRLPEKSGEIAITEFMYRQFNEYGFLNDEFRESVVAGQLTMEASGANSIIGKHISMDGRNGMFGMMPEQSYVIVGVVDTGFNYDRYRAYLPADDSTPSLGEESNMLEDMVLTMEIRSELNYGFHALGFLQKADIDALASMMNAGAKELGTYMHGMNSSLYLSIKEMDHDPDADGEYHGLQVNSVAASSALPSLSIEWLDGKGDRTTLAENEIIISSNMLQNMIPYEITLALDAELVRGEAERLYGAEAWAASESAFDTDVTYGSRLFYAAVWDYATEMLSDSETLNQVCSYALNYGREISTLAEARQFWLDFWVRDGYYEVPLGNSSQAIRNRGELELQMREDILPFLASIYGITLPEGIKEHDVGQLYSLLQRAEADKGVTVTNWEFIDLLRSVYARYDVEKYELWKNADFLALMFASDYANGWEDQWQDMDDTFRVDRTVEFYRNCYLSWSEYAYSNNEYGTYSGAELESIAKKAYMAAGGITIEDLLANRKIELVEQSYELGHTSTVQSYDFKVVGVYDSSKYLFSEMIVSDKVLADYNTWREENMKDSHYYREEIAAHNDGIWSYVIAPLTGTRAVLQTLVEMSYDETGDLKFELQNPVMDTLNTFNSFIEMGSQVFLYVGIGFAVFASLLLMNFIATSISYKKREIGVLRAVGARSSDVFKIFFSEALIIAAINFVLSTVAVIAAIIVTNTWMHNNGITVTLLHYGIRQFILMLLVSVGVALLSSFLPVYNIARRKPIDAIRDR